jgi:hypothetical protein
MVYVGSRLPADPTVEWGGSVQAACLIDPGLPLATALSLRIPDTERCVAYADLTPEARLAYLKWSSGGRRDGTVPVAFPFLHAAAIERRLLLDRPESREVTELIEELRRVAALFTGHAPFAKACSQLVSTVSARAVIESREALSAWGPADPADNQGAALVTRVAIAAKAVCGEAMTFNLAWAGYRALRPRIPNAKRNGAVEKLPEFLRLLEVRFAACFPAGLRLDLARGTHFHMSYQAINPGLEVGLSVEGWPGHLPDPASGRWEGMVALVDKTAADLLAFARMHEQGRGESAAAAETLPPDFSDLPRLVGLAGFVDWLDGLECPVAEVPAEELARRSVGCWPLSPSLRREMVRILRERGRGIEPDPAFGPIDAVGDAAWVFKIPETEGLETDPRPAFRMADAVSQIAGSVAAASGGRDAREAVATLSRLAEALGLETHESARLSARWQASGDRKLSPARLRKLVTGASAEDVAAAAVFAAVLSVHDGKPDTARVAALEKVFDALGVQRSALYGALHGAPVALPPRAMPSTGPVLVEAPPPARGFRIPPPEVQPTEVPQATPPSGMDKSRVQAVLEETRRVSESLARIYEAVEAPPAATGEESCPETTGNDFPGLDGDAGRLLSALLARAAWGRAEYDALARGMGLLPDGAMETINEWSYAELGEEILEDGDPLRVVSEILKGHAWAEPLLAKNTDAE